MSLKFKQFLVLIIHSTKHTMFIILQQVNLFLMLCMSCLIWHIQNV